MNYSIAIIGHHSRLDMAQYHYNKIMGDCSFARVKLFIDTEDMGLRWNFWRAIHDEEYQDDFRVFLQEDMLPCKHFYQSVGVAYTQLVMAKGYALPQFYSNTATMERAIAKGRHWQKASETWGACLAGPLQFFRNMAQWADDPEVQDSYGELKTKFLCHKPTFADEWVVEEYAKIMSVPIYHSVPVLVQHMGGKRSTLGHNGRQTRWFIGEDVSGLTVDWSKF